MRANDLPEEHRKYLKVPANPRVSNASILAMLSDNTVSLARLEEKHNATAERVREMGTKLDRATGSTDSRVTKLEDRFDERVEWGTAKVGTMEERNRWQEKMQKVILTLLIFVIGLILTLQFGIGFPVP